MGKGTKFVRKIIVAAIGFPLLIIGLILIPVPGPGGLPLCFLALLILSLEFDWAQPYLDKIKAKFRKIISDAKERQEKIKKG